VILPTKFVPPEQSLLAVGGLLLRRLGEPRSVSSLWDAARDDEGVTSFDKFVLALCFLYAIGLVELDGPLIRRRRR
jgi:hypothetical protein